MERRPLNATVGLAAAALLLSGCGNVKSSIQPTQLPVAATRVFSFSGAVMDTAYRPVVGSTVQVMDGPRAGTVATTDAAGRFSMPGTFTGAISVTASKDGYASAMRSVPPTRPPDLLPPPMEGERWESYFYLEPLGPFADVAGVYTLTLTADSACSDLPDEARTRSYTATIVPAGPGSRTSFLATLSDARFLSTFNRASIATAGTFARFSISNSTNGQSDSVPGVVEQVNQTTYLAIEAGGEGLFSASGITAPLDGYFEYCPAETTLSGNEYRCPTSARQCDSHHHQLTLVRR